MADGNGTVIVYYSLTGNCELVANILAEKLGADTLRLRPEKEPPKRGFGSYFSGGLSALKNDHPKLLNEGIDMTPYQTVVLVAPVWAGKCSSPMTSFVEGSYVSGKRVALIASSKSGNGDGELSYLREHLSANNEVVAELSVAEPLKNEDAVREKLDELAKKLS